MFNNVQANWLCRDLGLASAVTQEPEKLKNKRATARFELKLK